MKEFFAQYPESGAGELYRQQALETVEFNIHWVDRKSKTILAGLAKVTVIVYLFFFPMEIELL